MGTKNISLKKSAYERLASLKRENESFSDVVERLTKKKAPKYSDLAGILSEGTVEAIERTRSERRKADKTWFERAAKEFEEEGK